MELLGVKQKIKPIDQRYEVGKALFFNFTKVYDTGMDGYRYATHDFIYVLCLCDKSLNCSNFLKKVDGEIKVVIDDNIHFLVKEIYERGYVLTYSGNTIGTKIFSPRDVGSISLQNMNYHNNDWRKLMASLSVWNDHSERGFFSRDYKYTNHHWTHRVKYRKGSTEVNSKINQVISKQISNHNFKCHTNFEMMK
jgi:hypothetical protein